MNRICFFSFALLLLLSCADLGRDNPNDPKSDKYVSSSSGDEALSSSSAPLPLSSATVPSSSSSIYSSSSVVPIALSSSSVAVSSSSEAEPSSSSYSESSSSSAGKGNNIDNYKTVVIGTQTWMAKNLDYDASGSRCYEDDPTKCETYGRLYNWETARLACPGGWHLPTKDEWETLRDYVEEKNRFAYAGSILKDKYSWNNNNSEYDLYDFSALPGGYFNINKNNFDGVYNLGYWWTDLEYDATNAYRLGMDRSDEHTNLQQQDKNNLYSVRCMRD